eukprot:CAMPEP_0184856974 /NCGR_PEP_ID=MMETSP0580-20130426/2138_1 /TAXON_ID=1118495 /ORGANISM="Dactyliosolen fragilissimus" /LENGTH=223 /DNA_ID=CAMNT_0027352307 /DNA_START=58 /DNA_END=726 /DNA_ORIENTATION=-
MGREDSNIVGVTRTATVDNIKIRKDSSVCDRSNVNFNPFGPVVGEITRVLPATHKNQKGMLYLATKAICFRSTILFGIESGRVVIPFTAIEDILPCEADSIKVKDNEDMTYIFSCVDCQEEIVAVLEERLDISDREDWSSRSLKRSLSLPISSPRTPKKRLNEENEIETDLSAECTIAALAQFRSVSMVAASIRKRKLSVDIKGELESEDCADGTSGQVEQAW